MSLNKKILATAIVGGLFATAAQAQQVNLSATGGSTPVTFASEHIVPTAGLTLTNAANALDLASNLRYNFSNGEVRHARVECASNIRFAAGSAVTLAAGGGVAADLTGATIGSINGIGTNAIHFSITSGSGLLKELNQIVVSGNRSITSAAAGACSFSLYDQPSQAANGGAAGLITTISGNYLTFAPSYQLVLTQENGVANVEANPAFSRFVTPSVTGSDATASLGLVRFDLRSVLTAGAAQPRLATTGLPSTLTALLASGSHHIATGDFSAAANANGTFTGAAALARVFLSLSPTCASVDIPANVITATTARFNTGDTVVNHRLCYSPRLGVAIPVSTYTWTFNATSAAPTLYSTPNLGPSALGEITRNGTSLQAPLAQIPAGWLSRVALTNTGTLARPYTITAQTEAGTTAALGTAATGTIPAGGTIVLNVADIATFTGQPRGTLNVTVAGPNAQIQGLYQIVNPTSGSISNHVMVRPGSN